MTRRAQILAIVAAVLLVFFPVIFGEISMVDDHDMLTACNKAEWCLQENFLPGNVSGLYYRPLTIVSYLLNIHLTGTSPIGMHLVNVLLHLANTLLVFLLATQFMPQVGISPPEKKKTWLPLLLALFWGFHPLVTESVAWISGRTDVLAAFFVLLSTAFLLRFRENRSPLWLAFGLLAFFGGVLSKEVALAFLPGALLLLLAPTANTHSLRNANWKWLAMCLTVCALPPLLFFLLRSFAFSSNYIKIGITLNILLNNPEYVLFTFLRAIGFYTKKLFWPWPLNFAIDGVDPLYELLAFPVLAICLLLLWQRTLLGALFLTGMFFIVPALPLAVGQIAWMPFAERYLYLPSIFTTLAAGFFVAQKLLPRLPTRIGTALPLLVLTLFALATFQRSLAWQHNVTLMEDTAQKSPDNRTIWVLWGAALCNSGQYAKAVTVTQRADTIHNIQYNPDGDIVLGEALFRLGRQEEALAAFQKADRLSLGNSANALEGIMMVLTKQVQDGSTDRGKLFLLEQASLGLFQKKAEPMLLYHLAHAFWTAGAREKACHYWNQAAKRMKKEDPYRDFSVRLAAQARHQKGPRT